MTIAQDIVRALGGVWSDAKAQGMVAGLGHSARDRSMCVANNANGDGIVCFSFAGDCALAFKDKLRADGLLPPLGQAGRAWKPVAVNFKARPVAIAKAAPSSRGPERVTGLYVYCDEDGNAVYRTLRKETADGCKRFVAQRLVHAAWAFGLGDCPRVLYRLPRLLEKLNAIVYLVEGERKADKLTDWGLVATAVAFGANGWRADYAKNLAGRAVVILPDNDAPGAAFAGRAARDIVAAGGRARIVALPGLQAGGDIMDWHGDRDELRALVHAACGR